GPGRPGPPAPRRYCRCPRCRTWGYYTIGVEGGGLRARSLAVGEEGVGDELAGLAPRHRVAGQEAEAGCRTRRATVVAADHPMQIGPLHIEPERAVIGHIG